MINKKSLKKIMIEKVIELIKIVETDEMIHGNSYIQFGERMIKVVDPSKVRLR